MTRIAVVGDFAESVTAHVAINASLSQLARAAEGGIAHDWIATPAAETADEYARTELGLVDADNTEVNPDTPTPLISGLSCALVEVTDGVRLLDDSRVAALVGAGQLEAAYHCSYGVNRAYLSRFDGSDLVFSGFDADGDPRVFEHRSHPFFIGTAFQPERAALDGEPHPIVSAFVAACQVYQADRSAQPEVKNP